MRVPWWYGVAVTTVVWAGGFLVLGVAPASAGVVRQLSDPVALAMLVTWAVMPFCLYLDQRAFDDELAWNPTTGLWVLASLVWFVNVLVGTAYCFRRHAAAGGSPPSGRWQSAVLGTTAFWVVPFALDLVLSVEAIPDPLYDAMAALVFLAWIGLPTAVLIDAVRVRGYTDWRPNARVFVLGTAFPPVNVLVGAFYLYKRREAFDGVDTSRPFRLPESEGERVADVEGSPWFRRGGYVFGVYFLFLVALGAAMPFVSDLAFELLALVLWVPFGPFFAGCVYKDAAWRREHDRTVGSKWWLYLLSAVIEAVAFWYLVRRATKSSQYRRRHRTDAVAEE